jgi:pimeloyl-ACP methyl ester carboxylesterase
VTEGFATTPDGVAIHYRVVGTGADVVLAPFALYHGTALDRLAVGRRVVTYDPRGRGKSGAVGPDKVSLDLLLTDLDTVRRALGKDQVALIGYSGGGMELFVYALRNPGRVTRLVQLAPVGPRLAPYGSEMMADRDKRTDAAARAAFRRKKEAGEFADSPSAECRGEQAVTLPPLFYDRAKVRLVPDVCVYPNEYPKTLGAYFGGLFESIDGFDWRNSLAKVTIPRLVIHAKQDNIPLAASEEWVRGQPNARLLLIDRSGHMPHYEQPETTLQAVATFLAGKWPPGARAISAQ